MNNRNDLYAKLGKFLSIQRRQLAEQSPEAFAKLYLSHYFSLPPSRMHRELFEMLHPRNLVAGSKLAIAAPRGHAKSTVVSLALVLYCICFGLERYIMLISSTMDQVESLLKHIKDELSGNPLLLEDFPKVCEPPGSRPGPPRWTRRELITRNNVQVSAVSANTKVRGRRNKEHRPGLVIGDDLETDSGVASEVLRHSLQNWFFKVVSNSGSLATKFIVVGTVLHYDSLLAKLIDPNKSAGWISRKYQAIEIWDAHQELWEKWASIYSHREQWEDASGPEPAKRFYEQNRSKMLEGSQVLWPEREDYYTLQVLRLTNGQASFDSEKQNDPIDPATCLFPENAFRYWDDKFKDEAELLAYLEKRATFFGACDPSLGKAGKHRDDTAIITLARDQRDGLLYIFDAYIERLDPDRIIDHVIQFQQRRRYRRFAMESVQFQEFLAQELRKQSRISGCEIPIHEAKPSTDKMGRIQSLQPMVKSGGILFSRRHRTLLDQLRQFPKAAHDDGPDALHMAVELATVPPLKPGIGMIPFGPISPGSHTYGIGEIEFGEETFAERQKRLFREFIGS